MRELGAFVVLLFILAIVCACALWCPRTRLVRGGGRKFGTRVVAVGDSFVRPLAEDRNITVRSFKGKSVTGLSKPDDADFKRIENLVRKIKPSCLVLWFGMVDLNFVLPYRMVHGGDVKDFSKDTAMKLVDIATRLRKNCKRVVIILPTYSPVQDEHVLESLRAYGTIKPGEEAKLAGWPEVRKKYVDDFNRTILDTRLPSGVSAVDLNAEVSKGGEVGEDFLTPSLMSVHIRWKHLFPLLFRLLPCRFRPDLDRISANEEKYTCEKYKKLASKGFGFRKLRDVTC